MTPGEVICRLRKDSQAIRIPDRGCLPIEHGRQNATQYKYAKCGCRFGGKVHYEICKVNEKALSVQLHDERSIVDDLRVALFDGAKLNKLKCSKCNVSGRFRIELCADVSCDGVPYEKIVADISERLNLALGLFEDIITKHEPEGEWRPSAEDLTSLEQTLAADERVNEIRKTISESSKDWQRFNILNVLGLSDYEIRHSFMLVWLLDPSGNHGFGNEFLNHFLNAIKKANASNGLEYEGIINFGRDASNNEIRVEREIHNIDIFLVDEHNKVVVVVENKWDADEHDDQLKRYKECADNVYQDRNGWKKYCVFLTPTGRRPSRDDWGVLSYGDILNGLKDVLHSAADCERKVNPDVETLVKHYADIVQRKVKMEDGELEKKCTEIFEKHKEVFSYIFKRVDKCMLRHPLLMVDSKGLRIGEELLKPEGSALTYIQFKRRLPTGTGTSVHYEIEKPEGKDQVVLSLHVEMNAHDWVRKELPAAIQKIELPDGFNRSKRNDKVYYTLDKLDMREIEASRKRVIEKFQQLYDCCEPVLRKFDLREKDSLKKEEI